MSLNRSRFLWVALLVAAIIGAVISPHYVAAEKKAEAKVSNGKKPASLEEALKTAKWRRKKIHELEEKVEHVEGIYRDITSRRLFRARILLLESELDFADHLLAEGKTRGEQGEDYIEVVGKMLSGHPELLADTFDDVSVLKSSEEERSAAEQAAALSVLTDELHEMRYLFDLSRRSIDISERFELEVKDDKEQLQRALRSWSLDLLVLLELSIERSKGLAAGAEVLPDEVELAAKATVSDQLVLLLADTLTDVAGLMDELGLNTAGITEQVLTATGKLTSDALDVGVMKKLLLGWGERLMNLAIQDGPDIILKVLLFVGIVFLTFKLSTLAEKVVRAGIEHSSANLSTLLQRMVIYVAGKLIFLVGILIALSQLGISLGPLLAGFGIAGFIVGFALQDALSNFASGMMILVYRPYDVGDLIETSGIFGTVSHMSLVNTTILTLDNQTIVMPNNKIWGDVIKNVTAQNMRRVDMVFGISYGDDIPKAEFILNQILNDEDRVLSDPEPIVRVHELGDSSVNFVVRPWVKTDDYWEAYWAVTKAVKLRFDEEGVSIPFPQRDVHLDGSVLFAGAAPGAEE